MQGNGPPVPWPEHFCIGKARPYAEGRCPALAAVQAPVVAPARTILETSGPRWINPALERTQDIVFHTHKAKTGNQVTIRADSQIGPACCARCTAQSVTNGPQHTGLETDQARVIPVASVDEVALSVIPHKVTVSLDVSS